MEKPTFLIEKVCFSVKGLKNLVFTAKTLSFFMEIKVSHQITKVFSDQNTWLFSMEKLGFSKICDKWIPCISCAIFYLSKKFICLHIAYL